QYPPPEVAFGVGQGAGRDRGPALEVGQVGREPAEAGRLGAADHVAHDAWPLLEHLLSVPLRVIRWLDGAFDLLRAPAVERVARLDDGEDLHMRVLRAAELGAAAVPLAFLVGLDPDHVGPARDDIALFG